MCYLLLQICYISEQQIHRICQPVYMCPFNAVATVDRHTEGRRTEIVAAAYGSIGVGAVAEEQVDRIRDVVVLCDADQLVWEKPRVMCEGFMRNKPIVTSSGRIITPAYDYSGGRYKLRCSDNEGESFYNVAVDGKPDVNVYDEIAVCEISLDKLRFLARTNRGYYVYSDSLDGGNTWTVAQEYEKAPSSRCYYGKLRNGMIAYVRNISDEKRLGMKICLSEDGGETFPYEMMIDNRENLSYPDLDEDEHGNIYIVYDRERDNRIKLDKETWVSEAAKEILVCKITVDDVKNSMLSNGSFLRRIISKAKMNNVET